LEYGATEGAQVRQVDWKEPEIKQWHTRKLQGDDGEGPGPLHCGPVLVKSHGSGMFGAEETIWWPSVGQEPYSRSQGYAGGR
jgi:hypothetical protein